MSKSQFEQMVEAAIKKIYDDEGFNGTIDETMVKYFADQYWQAATEGFGADITDFELGTPDYLFLQKLKENVWHFAGAKNYQELKAISDELIGPDGNLRSFSDFKINAMQISDEHNNAWLQTEYNFAVAGGQMASTWQKIIGDKHLLPLLQYKTVGDDRVRPEHQELEGVTRPVDDAFWVTYYPPNGWNCRCFVRQLTEDNEATLLKDIIYPEKMPDLFKYNVGKAGVIFPPKHPYYNGLPTDIQTQVENLIKKQ